MRVEARQRALDNEGAEAILIAHAILTEIEADRAATDFAVLARTNHIAREIADTLRAHDVPVQTMEEVIQPEDWRRAVSILAGLKDIDADKLEETLKEQAVSDESIALINTRFDELPVTADLCDLHASLKLDRPRKKLVGEGVFCSTIHASKGMEFDTVILAGMEDEVIPGNGKKVDIEEERRIFYVGMTRAKRRLIITWAKFRSEQWGQRRPIQHTASRFISEAGI